VCLQPGTSTPQSTKAISGFQEAEGTNEWSSQSPIILGSHGGGKSVSAEEMESGNRARENAYIGKRVLTEVIPLMASKE
jgi:hypothetical protein